MPKRRFRDAINGLFVSAKTAMRRKSTTVGEALPDQGRVLSHQEGEIVSRTIAETAPALAKLAESLSRNGKLRVGTERSSVCVINNGVKLEVSFSIKPYRSKDAE